MQMVAPVGQMYYPMYYPMYHPMYQSGTLSGSPLAMTAGIATIQGLTAPGVYVAPSPFEAGFLSTAHTSAVIDATLAAAERAFAAAK